MLRTIIHDYKQQGEAAGVSGFDSIPLFVELMRKSLIDPPFTTITGGVNDPSASWAERDSSCSAPTTT